MIVDSARWDDFPFRAGDIVISTPAKCGTTWTQMICALLIFQGTDFPRPLDVMSPWFDMLTHRREDLLAELESQRHRRFVKTHTPLDGLPFDGRATYICVGRDPRDAAMSWDNHLHNLDFAAVLAMRAAAGGQGPVDAPGPPDTQVPPGGPATPDGPPSPGGPASPDGPPQGPPQGTARDRFWTWIEAENEVMLGLPAMLRHLASFWAARSEPNVVLLHYDELKQDLEGQMRRLAARLGIDVPEHRWPELARAATFEEMRGNADELAPDKAIWHDPERFFNRGTSGQWRDLLDEDDLRRYREIVSTRADPELLAWLHRGPIVG